MLYKLFIQANEWLIGEKERLEEGQTLIEYALIIVLIAIVVIAALTILGPTIREVFSNIDVELGGAGT